MSIVENPKRHAKSSRLLKAVEKSRAGAGSQGAGPARAELAAEHRKRVQGAIRYPNAAGALRQHVSEVREAAPRPTFRLRLPPSTQVKAADPAPHAPVPAALASVAVPAARRADLPAASRADTLLAGATAVEMPRDLGELVRRTRERRRLTQAELAALAGTGRRFVSELEAGKTSLEFGRVLMVCDALDLRLLAVGSADER